MITFRVKNREKLEGIWDKKNEKNPVVTKDRGKRSHECFMHMQKPLGAF